MARTILCPDCGRPLENMPKNAVPGAKVDVRKHCPACDLDIIWWAK